VADTSALPAACRISLSRLTIVAQSDNISSAPSRPRVHARLGDPAFMSQILTTVLVTLGLTLLVSLVEIKQASKSSFQACIVG
jgi:hypothetical protein